MKEKVLNYVESMRQELCDMAWQIFDHPELGGEEVFAQALLTDALEARGFQVERGVFGEKTSFRAVWSQGEGGPTIGFVGEYDALKNAGHACGHHMQTPAAIGAAPALKKVFEESGTPCTLVIYGSPAEETYGGKIVMAENGAFLDLDIAIVTHATGKQSFVSGASKALNGVTVEYFGTSSHASGSPHLGRSACDAMLLTFHGVEFLREHVKDDARMHYSVAEGTGPSNVVCPYAKANFSLRSNSDKDLDDIIRRFRKIVEGACLMTETTAEVSVKRRYAARIPNPVLIRVGAENFRAIGCDLLPELTKPSGGSTDVGNLSAIVPTANLAVEFVDFPTHSQGWADNGKNEFGEACLMKSAKVAAGTAFDLIMNPELIAQAKEEFRKFMEQDR